MKGTLADFRKINFLRVQPHLFATLCGCASLPATHPCNFQAIPRSDGEVMTEKRPVSPTAAPFRALLAPCCPPSAAPATSRPRRRLTPRCGAPSQLQTPTTLSLPPHTAALAPSAAQRQRPTSSLARGAGSHRDVAPRHSSQRMRTPSLPSSYRSSRISHATCRPPSQGRLHGQRARYGRRPALSQQRLCTQARARFRAFCGGHAALRASRVLPTEPGSNNTLELQALMPPSCTPTAGGSRSSSPSCR
jgi:hypothetical protein